MIDNEIIWQLIDTTAKVGLGAIIAVMFTLLLIRRREPKGFQADQRRLEILEKISTDVGTISHVFAKYCALVVESMRFGERWPASRHQELEQITIDLARKFEKLADAESKLLMLGEKALEKNLRLYGAKVAQFRRQVHVGQEAIEEDDILAMKRDINLLREQFYDFLSKKYDRLLAANA